MFGVSTSDILKFSKIVSDEHKKLEVNLKQLERESRLYDEDLSRRIEHCIERVRKLESGLAFKNRTTKDFEDVISTELEKLKIFQDSFLTDKEKAYEEHLLKYGPEDDCSLLIKQKSYREGVMYGMRTACELLK